MRQPMEEMYGAEVFAKMWEAWVDGISEYTHRPEGRHPSTVLALAFFKSGVRRRNKFWKMHLSVFFYHQDP